MKGKRTITIIMKQNTKGKMKGTLDNKRNHNGNELKKKMSKKGNAYGKGHET